MKVHFSSLRLDWRTPKAVFQILDAEFNFTLDPASSKKNHLTEKFFTEEENGLEQSWQGHNVFVNPPYGRELPKWVEKAYLENQGGGH